MDQTLILDISSDEEVGLDTTENFDWISMLLEDVGGDDDSSNRSNSNGVVVGEGDDSDDVVLVREVFAKPKMAKSLVPINDDDDCVVLDCDPDKPETEVKGSEEDSDELLIISEKGQVACRDYPHSRHLCAKLVFQSTPHSSHCNQCHCYVCDSLAPCAYWGSGVSSVDHCHATDKDEYWRLERKKVQQSKIRPLPITKPPSLPRLPELPQNSAGPNPVPRPNPTCGPPSSFGPSSIISQGRSQRPNIAAARNRFQPHLISQQLFKTCNSHNRTPRRLSLAPSHPIFKGPGVISRAGVSHRSPYVPRNNVNLLPYLEQQLLSKQLGTAKPIENNINLTKSTPQFDTNLGSWLPNSSSISTNMFPSQSQQVYSHPQPHTLSSQFQGSGQPTAITSNDPHIYLSGSQIQNVSSPIPPPNSWSQIPDVSGPNFTSNMQSSITQRSFQPSTVTGNLSSPIFPSSENSQVQGAVGMHEILRSVEQITQMNSSSLDFDVDNWLGDYDSILGAQDGSYGYDMNNQPASVDAGMLYFDFETSWKGLTHS